MAYETKVLLLAIARIARTSKDMEDFYNALCQIANAEGVILEPFQGNEKEI